jgi:GT2 family glycosyltransferase
LLTGLNFVVISEDLPDVQSFIAAVYANPDTLMTYKAAIHSHDSMHWKKAIDKEFDSLIKNKTWKVIDQPPNIRVLHSKWIYKIKRCLDYSISRYKARWVIKGCKQLFGIDYDQTYAGVAKTQT